MDAINKGLCPVCGKQRGKHSPRQALMVHIKTSREKEHVLWREQNYAAIFRRGQRATTPPTEEEKIDSIIELYGKERLLRVLAS